MPRTPRIIAVLILIAAVLATAALFKAHRHQVAWRFGDHNPILAFNLGGVALDANGQGATEDEQHDIDMLDMSLDKLRRVFYKPREDRYQVRSTILTSQLPASRRDEQDRR